MDLKNAITEGSKLNKNKEQDRKIKLKEKSEK